MKQKLQTRPTAADKTIKGMRWAPGKRRSEEVKICSVLNGLFGGESIAKLCRHEDISHSILKQMAEGCFCKPTIVGLQAIRLLRARLMPFAVQCVSCYRVDTEAVHNHEDERCNRHVGPCLTGVGLRLIADC